MVHKMSAAREIKVKLPFPDAAGCVAHSAPVRVPESLRGFPGSPATTSPPLVSFNLPNKANRARAYTTSSTSAPRFSPPFLASNTTSQPPSLSSSPNDEDDVLGEWPPLSLCFEFEEEEEQAAEKQRKAERASGRNHRMQRAHRAYSDSHARPSKQ